MTKPQAVPGITLLAEGLHALVLSGPAPRLPALENILGRGRPAGSGVAGMDSLRWALFGQDAGGSVPVGALTRAANGEVPSPSEYWMRIDPVTLMADMTHVFMTGVGLDGLDDAEAAEIESIIGEVLDAEGMTLHSGRPGQWCAMAFETQKSTPPPVTEALGADISDLLHGTVDAGRWRRIMNEMEIALHSCPVNSRRRARGLPTVNSAWFWGGGHLPTTVSVPFDAVFSDHPVTRGLATAGGRQPRPVGDLHGSIAAEASERILVDWTIDRSLSAGDNLRSLESLAGRLNDHANRCGQSLELQGGSGLGRVFDRRAARRFWRKRRPLDQLLNSENENR